METALYYIFFSSHPVELATLMRDKEYYVSKAEIVDYLKMHEPRFKKIQDKLGLLSRLADLYSDLSAIVHGQLPGSWTAHVGIASIKKNEAIANDVVDKFVKAEDVVHKLFLCTVAQSRWDDFSTSAKKALIKGIPGDIKILLNLDMA